MGKLVLKMGVYAVLITISLEILARVFYLGEDKPSRFVDEKQVEKWVPNQDGYAITGNRNQNFIRYHINESGFNSYREFVPTASEIEIALVGDSFIEGFHQPFKNSIGRMMEKNFNDSIKVFEYGYSGYDMADQLHLIDAYKNDFKLIDKVFIKTKFSNDLGRGEYYVQTSRLNMESPMNRLLKKSRLLIYLAEIGAVDPVKKIVGNTINLIKGNPGNQNFVDSKTMEKQFLDNFKSLVEKYNYDKTKNVILLDETETSTLFLNYLKENGFEYLDYGRALEKSKKKTTLVYDQHWNGHGRALIAKLITENIRKDKSLKL